MARCDVILMLLTYFVCDADGRKGKKELVAEKLWIDVSNFIYQDIHFALPSTYPSMRGGKELNH